MTLGIKPSNKLLYLLTYTRSLNAKISNVDLRDFLSIDAERKQEFVNEFGNTYQDIGFVALRGPFLINGISSLRPIH